MSFNGFTLNVVLESLKFRIKGVIRKHEMELAKPWLQPGASKYHISTSNAIVEVLQRPQVLENSSDLSYRKLQDCLYLGLIFSCYDG